MENPKVDCILNFQGCTVYNIKRILDGWLAGGRLAGWLGGWVAGWVAGWLLWLIINGWVAALAHHKQVYVCRFQKLILFLFFKGVQ